MKEIERERERCSYDLNVSINNLLSFNFKCVDLFYNDMCINIEIISI